MPPVYEPTATTTSAASVWPIGIPQIKSQVDLINFAREIFSKQPTSTSSSSVVPRDIQNLNPIVGSLASGKSPTAMTAIAATAANMTPQIGGLTSLGSLTSIPAELLLQLSRLDNINLLPAVGSPTNPSSSSCSEPPPPPTTTITAAPASVSLPSSVSSTSQQQQTISPTTVPFMPSGHGTTVDQQNSRRQQQQQKMQDRKYSMDTLQHHVMPQPHQLPYFPNHHFMTASNDVFAAMEMSQKQSPPGLFKIAKNEPSSSSNSQPGTPAMSDRRAVPACAICGTDSTGIHFGVDACAACSAFFRRTVVLNKDYSCTKGGNCTVVKDGSAGQKCRACRFRKCINSGMDKNSVQHRRDAIGKYSAGVKRELSPDNEYEPPSKLSTSSEPSTSAGGFPMGGSPPSRIPRVPSTSRVQPSPCFNPSCGQKSVLHELICRQNFLVEQRQLFYAGCLGDWFRKPTAVENQALSELTDFSNCMFHLWKIEPRLAADFMNRNRYLDPLPIVEKLKIYRNFVIMRQSVEEPYLTWRHGGLEKRWFVMPNNTYIDFTDVTKYFTNGALKDLNLDCETTKNLFLPSFTHAMDTIGQKMKNLNVSDTELTVLLGLVLLDPGIYGIQESTRRFLKGVRDQLIHDVYMYYEDEMASEYDPEIRMADLFMLVAAIKIHSIKTSENMHMLRVFDLIPADACFNQMLDVESVNVSPDGKRDTEAEQGPMPVSVPEAARVDSAFPFDHDDDSPPVLERNCDEPITP